VQFHLKLIYVLIIAPGGRRSGQSLSLVVASGVSLSLLGWVDVFLRFATEGKSTHWVAHLAFLTGRKRKVSKSRATRSTAKRTLCERTKAGLALTSLKIEKDRSPE